MNNSLARLISVARGETPADVILANGRVVNVFNGKIEQGNVAIAGERIAGVGDYTQAKQVLDISGRYVAPGFIDGHVHLESSMLDPAQYARAVVPHGTTGIVTDLHEIANVSGMEGMRYVLDSVRRLPLDLFLMAPSCVPATHLETSGANITPEDIRRILRWKECIGLGEVMNFPGVLFGDEGVLSKIGMAAGKIVDGHAPGVSGKDLAAYIAAGINSDHESVALEEAEEKLRQGMYVMIREGSSEKNLSALLPLVNDNTYHRCMLVIDDRSCTDLLREGDMDAVVRKAIAEGLDSVRAIQMASINTAARFRLDGLGAVAPGHLASVIVLDSLEKVQAGAVFYRGRLVARDGKALFSARAAAADGEVRGTMNIRPFGMEALKIRATGEKSLVIEMVPGQIITRKRKEPVEAVNGYIEADASSDILKLVTVERHNGTGNMGLGLVKGFGLKRGALATSVAHDSHNVVAAGAGDEDLYAAIKAVENMGGGLAVVDGGRTIAALALPVAGLLSDQPLENVVTDLEKVEQAVLGLGATLPAPFAALSFLALPVIPELRLTDLGMVDVSRFEIVK